ncbi:hypothetical protein AQUCO_00500424v1 [Aquilegia coerulea]|uniref:Uncharacterized protein n=1 Tax=Aquilegia coerulea TaxID=218851 RepID=A0A2G5ERX1_AQUCA|nr:hypothetical protein AQUCO_00500424v1 [Aquilegia coerulea]
MANTTKNAPELTELISKTLFFDLGFFILRGLAMGLCLIWLLGGGGEGGGFECDDEIGKKRVFEVLKFPA